MHRAYQPLKPCTSKYLQKKWDQECYELHKSKVREARAVVDTKGAPTPVQVQLKLKKYQLEEERLAVIERDNRILSAKLSHIACSNGLVDHRNHYPERSLNGAKRREEFLLLTQENQAILQRIKARKSEYRHQLWEEHSERTECWRDVIARYPRGMAQQKPRRSVRFVDSEPKDCGRSLETGGRNAAAAQRPAEHANDEMPRRVRAEKSHLPPLKGAVK